MQFDQVNKEIVSFDFKAPFYIAKVRISWRSWFSTNVIEEVFHTTDLMNFTSVHTNSTAGTWWSYDQFRTSSYSEGEKFSKWLGGESFLINNGMVEHGGRLTLDSETIIGKIFKAKKAHVLFDKDNNKYPFNKDECFTVVDITTATNGHGYYIPVYCILANDKKLYVKKISSDFSLV